MTKPSSCERPPSAPLEFVIVVSPTVNVPTNSPDAAIVSPLASMPERPSRPTPPNETMSLGAPVAASMSTIPTSYLRAPGVASRPRASPRLVSRAMS